LKAAVLREFNKDLVIEDLKVPDLMEGQVLVDIKFTGICGAQVNQKKGTKISKAFLPCLMGHEGSGIVLDIGKNVESVSQGDHVVIHWRKSSGIESDFPKYFSNTTNQNIGSGLATTFSEKSIISENRLTKIDKKYPLDVASLLGCSVTTGFGIIENELNIEKGNSLLVSGIGGVGLSTILAANLKNLSEIIAIDLNEEKLSFSKEIGATHTINSQIEQDFISSVRKITNNIGVKYAIDTTGSSKIINGLLDVIKPGGFLVLVGQPEKNKQLIITNFLKLYNNITIFDSQGGATNPEIDIPKLLDLHDQQKINLNTLINKRIKLEDINEGFKIIENNSFVGGRIIIEN
jgi:S-(hydroxymethyl)glutathione dehydrogenase/alcohol dehydrogenase